MPSFKNWLLGKGDKVKKAKLLTKDQEDLMKLMKKGLKHGEGPFADMFGEFNEEEFKEGVANPMLKNFQENVLPQLQEQFIAGNQVLGSGMRRGQLKASENMQSDLSKLMYQARQQHKEGRQRGLENMLGQRTHENIYQKGYPGALAEFGSEFMRSAGKKLGSNISPDVDKMGGGGGGGGGAQAATAMMG